MGLMGCLGFLEHMRRFQSDQTFKSVWQSLGALGRVLESSGKFKRVWERLGAFGRVQESSGEYERDIKRVWERLGALWSVFEGCRRVWER